LEDLVTREEKMGLVVVAFYQWNGRDFKGMKLVVGFCFCSCPVWVALQD
jgi:hypothetical protein